MNSYLAAGESFEGKGFNDRVISVEHAGCSAMDLLEKASIGKVSAVVVIDLLKHLSFNETDCYRLYISVGVLDGVIVLTGVTYTLKAKNDLISWIEHVAKEVKGVRSVDAKDVVHAVDGDTFVASDDASPWAKKVIAMMEEYVVREIRHAHALNVNGSKDVIRVTGRVEYADEYEKLIGCASALGRLNPKLSIDCSSVTTSKWASSTTKVDPLR
jgi:hypothetical protein